MNYTRAIELELFDQLNQSVQNINWNNPQKTLLGSHSNRYCHTSNNSSEYGNLDNILNKMTAPYGYSYSDDCNLPVLYNNYKTGYYSCFTFISYYIGYDQKEIKINLDCNQWDKSKIDFSNISEEDIKNNPREYFQDPYFQGCKKRCDQFIENTIENLEKKKNADTFDIKGSQCRDLSVSFRQGDSVGIQGYEGRCGQTAAANILFANCLVIPKTVFENNQCNADDILWDTTPGLRPDTLRNNLKEYAIKNGCFMITDKSNNTIRNDYINENFYINFSERKLQAALKEQERIIKNLLTNTNQFPMMVLVGSEYSGENSLLHWVSVYPSDKPGKVKINDNGQQLFLEIEHLAKLTLKGSIILHEKYNFGEPGFIGI